MLFAETDPAATWTPVIVAVVSGVVTIITTVGGVILAYIRLKAELTKNTDLTVAAAKSANAAAVTSKAAATRSDAAAETTASIHQIVNGERSAMQAKIEALTAENARLKATNVAAPAPAG